MIRTLIVIIIATTLLLPLSAQRKGNYQDPPMRYDEGWTTLFNGRDLQGWVVVTQKPSGGNTDINTYFGDTIGDQETFTIENGVLKTTGEPLGYIRTQDVYDNFVFEVEVKFNELGNSGLLLHIRQDMALPDAIECQFYYSHIGRVFPLRTKMDGGEMIHDNSSKLGEWNKIQVVSEEGRLATSVNGVVVGLGANAVPSMGHIGLQSEGTAIEFRNIRVKRYTPAHHMRNKPKE
jgi:3-keto-disaccharide hydrolase